MAISAELQFKTILRDRDVNLRHILHTLTQNSDKFECFFVSKLTGKVSWREDIPDHRKLGKKFKKHKTGSMTTTAFMDLELQM